MPLRARDFESRASAIPPLRPYGTLPVYQSEPAPSERVMPRTSFTAPLQPHRRAGARPLGGQERGATGLLVEGGGTHLADDGVDVPGRPEVEQALEQEGRADAACPV